MRQKFQVCVIFLVTLMMAATLSAQNITATITGTVTDATGAVIPGATVTATNTATGLTRTAQSTGTGAYTLPQLPVGTYTVKISDKGFTSYQANDVTLHVGDQLGLNVSLKAGSVSQEVTVSTAAVPVQTASAAQSDTVTGTQIRNLQLNNRNFEQLVTLQPGVSSSLPAIINFGITTTNNVSVNGQRATANNWTVDGADINDSGSNGTLVSIPSVDALQEFKIARSTYDAQYGRSGGGQINVVTKSGTNQFHGGAYEFVRNNILNANDTFLKSKPGSTNTRPPFHYNDFGYTVGGPIVKDKTFFFWSEEWRKTSTPSTMTAYLPSPAELTGDFNGIATLDPTLAPSKADGTPCVVNNKIDQSCFSANAQAYLKYVYGKYSPSGPDSKGNYTLVTPVNGLANTRQELVRLDHQLTSKVELFATYTQNDVPTTEPGGLFNGNPLPGLASTSTNTPSKTFVSHMTAIISPSIVNELAFNYSWAAINSNGTGATTDPAFFNALTHHNPYPEPYGRIDGVGFSGTSGLAQQTITGVSLSSAPYHERNIDKNLYDNLSLIKGNHTIRTGFTVQWMRKTENGPLATNGNFTFKDVAGPSGQMPAFGNFLLGQPYTFSQASRDIIPDLRFANVEGYAQDDWKLTPRLTLNLGVRYSFFPSPMDTTGTLSAFDPARYNPANAPTLDSKGNFVTGGITPNQYLNGIIIGGSGASSYGSQVTSPWGYRVNPSNKDNWAPRLGFAWDPFGDGKTAVRGGYGFYYDRSLDGIWEQNQFANPPFISNVSLSVQNGWTGTFENPGAATALYTPYNIITTGSPSFLTPYSQNWNLSIQRQIANNTRLEVAYVGNKGTHLLGQTDMNQASLAARGANPTANVNAVRPYVGFQQIKDRNTQFDSSYNSLQVSLNRQVSRGLNLGVAYTWSKAITDNSADRDSAVLDTYNLRLDRGPASFNRPQVLVFNYIYDLPFFQGQQGAVGRVLGGWEVSGITTMEEGTPVTVTQGSDPFNSFDWNTKKATLCPSGCYPGGIGIDPSSVSPRPDITGDPNNGPQTAAQWFNTGAFKDAIAHFGTSGRGVVQGPGMINWDFSLIKNVKLSERISTQIRGEFFNVFNHVNLNNPNTNFDRSNFGTITGDYAPRTVQLGIKVIF